jgi:hypothetical protein
LFYATFSFEPFRKPPLVCKRYFSYFIRVSYTSREITQGSQVVRFHDDDDNDDYNDDNNNNNNDNNNKNFLRNFVQ